MGEARVVLHCDCGRAHEPAGEIVRCPCGAHWAVTVTKISDGD